MNLVKETTWRLQGRTGVRAGAPRPRQASPALESGRCPPLGPGPEASDYSPQQAAAIIPQHRPSSFQQIGAFENACAATLPRDYVEFLLAGDFAAPLERFFDVTEDGETALETVQCFLGFGLPWPVGNLDYVLHLYAGGLPQGVVPIAGNGAGDYICMDLRGGDSARRAPVSLWRIGHFWRSGEWREQDLLPLSDSFSVFLGGMRAAPRKGSAGIQHTAASVGHAGKTGSAVAGATLFRRWSA